MNPVREGTIADQIVQSLGHTAELYHRLLLVVSPSGSGKTVVLQDLSKRINTPIINSNLELSRRMLDLTEKQRVIKLPELMDEIVSAIKNDIVILDNLEMIFDLSLKHDPIRLLQNISRNKTVIASWNGSILDGHLVYAEPGHPEYRRYSTQNLMIISIYGR